MKLTLFHRTTDALYDHPCDCANVRVLDSSEQPAGFIGASWGEFSDPPDCVDWAILEPEGDAVEVTLSFWGIHRDPNPPATQDDPPPEVSEV